MRKSLIAVAVIAAVAAGVYLMFFRGGSDEASYVTTEVRRGDITSYVSATGTIKPKVSVLVGTEVSGTIKDIYVEENDHVKKGQLMLTLDRELFEAKLTQAKASLEAAQAAYDELVTEQAAVKAQVEAAIEQTKAQYAESDAKLMRGQSLFKKGMISREDLDALMSDQAVKKAAYNQALAGKATLTAYESKIAAAASKIKEAQAGLDTAKTNLDKSEIDSPMDGVVITRNVDVGQTVAASFNTPELFEVGDLGVMEVEVSVDEADVGRAKVGMEADFTVDAYPGEVFKGVVSRVSYSPETVQNVVTYKGIIEVENKELKLRPGMTANVNIITSRRKNVLMVPNSALRVKLDLPVDGEQGGPPEKGASERQGSLATDTGTVYVMEDGRPEKRTIKTGVTDYKNTEVISGLKEGDLVVTDKASHAGNSQNSGRRPMGMFH